MHRSVLLEETLKYLNLSETSIIVDCTLGYGGHSSEILKKIKRGFLFAFDQDEDAIKASTLKLKEISNNYEIIKSNFVHLKEELEKRKITKVDGILFDLGVSSPQLDEKERGFSFHQDAKLDMRMDKDNPLSAYEVVNTYPYEKLIDIFFRYGEERYAREIAKGIIKSREKKPIETTLELVEIIKNNVPEKYKREKHPARKVFQAIRIEVNQELEVFEQALRQALDLIKVGGRVCVITFHSLEDRLCKQIFNEVSSINKSLKELPIIPEYYQPKYKIIGSFVPTKKEIETNHRARSAKLRVIEKIRE
ncbi:MAG: 16S rRNA (cytosine(1402)-N(4))-methyltransferase RsmH [Mollicutes bacterium]|nr:16S rRNA (cytosine(1402)-N(4))-methyltransferase RsmH [Mollicutes bacterium]